jgi:hypothetical protein
MSPASKEMSAQEVIALNREYTFFSWSVQSAVSPIPVERAEGAYFWDVDGKRYIDFASQLMNVNIGHQHPKVVQAIKDQADKLCYVYPGMATDVRGKLGQLLAEITPGNLKKTFFTLGTPAATRSSPATAHTMARLMGPLLPRATQGDCQWNQASRAWSMYKTPIATAVPSAGHWIPATANVLTMWSRSFCLKGQRTWQPSSTRVCPVPAAS